jgi:hypothetical protein
MQPYCIVLSLQVIANTHTVWTLLGRQQGEDRYTKYSEHLHTPSLDNAACVFTAVVG